MFVRVSVLVVMGGLLSVQMGVGVVFPLDGLTKPPGGIGQSEPDQGRWARFSDCTDQAVHQPSLERSLHWAAVYTRPDV